MTTWIGGLALGARTHSLAFVEIVATPTGRMGRQWTNRAWEQTTEFADHGHVRHLERIAGSVAAVVERLRVLLSTPPITPETSILVDATHVGRGIVDAIREAPFRPRVRLVHVADADRSAGAGHVPVRDLAALLAIVLEERRLHVAAEISEAGALRDELRSFEARVVTPGALSTAAILPVWTALRGRPRFVAIPTPDDLEQREIDRQRSEKWG